MKTTSLTIGKKKGGQSHSDLPIPNLKDDDLCPVHETKGAQPHPCGECALNPRNKDHKDLNKYFPKPNKGKTPPTAEIHTAEFNHSNLNLVGIVLILLPPLVMTNFVTFVEPILYSYYLDSAYLS